jgi:hypothetical protein
VFAASTVPASDLENALPVVFNIGKKAFDKEQGHDMSRDHEYTDCDTAGPLANDVDQRVGSAEQS